MIDLSKRYNHVNFKDEYLMIKIKKNWYVIPFCVLIDQTFVLEHFNLVPIERLVSRFKIHERHAIKQMVMTFTHRLKSIPKPEKLLHVLILKNKVKSLSMLQSTLLYK